MYRSCRTVALAALVCLTSAPWVHAGTIDLTLVGALHVDSTVVRTINPSTTGPTTPTQVVASLLKFTGAGGDVLAYCVEAQQGVNSGTFTEDFTLQTVPGNIGGLSAIQSDAIRLLFGQVPDAFSASLPAVTQAAVQIAIWEIARETSGAFDVAAGTVLFSNSTPSGALADAQSLLNAVALGTGPRDMLVHGLSNSRVQDLLVRTSVPEPGVVMLLGLGALAVVRRRRR